MWQYYHDMKRTYLNHDIEDYIDYHDIRYIAHHYTVYPLYSKNRMGVLQLLCSNSA